MDESDRCQCLLLLQHDELIASIIHYATVPLLTYLRYLKLLDVVIGRSSWSSHGASYM